MNRPLKLALIAIAPCVLASTALAQSQSQLNASAARDERTADQALNRQYTATMNGLSPASRTLLRNAQRSWIAFRDQQCRYESSAVRGGSALFPRSVRGCGALWGGGAACGRRVFCAPRHVCA